MSKDKENKQESTQDKEPVKEALTNKQQVERLDKEIKGYEATVVEFEIQLKTLAVDLQEENKTINERVEKELDAFPESSPKGLLEKIFKMPQLPKRGQLQESIDKVNIALQHTQGKRNKVVRERAKLIAEIKEIGLNTLTNRLCESLKTTVDRFIAFEDQFLLLKQEALEIGLLDSMFFNRINIKEYPRWYIELFGLTLMKPASLPGLTANLFIETAQRMGPDTENPLKTDTRFSRQETKHLSEPILEGHKAFETPGPDAAAAEKLSEVFEEGPRVPTY